MTEGVIPDYQKDPNPYQNLGAGGPAEREATALERIADALDNIAALLASQRVPAGSAHPAGKNGDDGWIVWGGGLRPVQYGILVDVMLRNGESITAVAPDELAWWHDDDDRDIAAYRIHNP